MVVFSQPDIHLLVCVSVGRGQQITLSKGFVGFPARRPELRAKLEVLFSKGLNFNASCG